MVLTKGQAVITISEFLREMLADFVGAAIKAGFDSIRNRHQKNESH